MVSWANVLYNTINGKQELCSLCFETVDDSQINLQDEIIFNNKDTEITMKMFDILSVVVDGETCNRILLNSTICKSCARLAINSYKFIMMSKENTLTYNNILDSLTNCINIPNSNVEANTLYITLDTKYFTTEQYYDKKQAKSTTSALKTLESIIENQAHIKYELTSEEFDYDVKVKRKRTRHSIPIRTKDMLYDENDKLNMKCKVCLKTYPSLSNLRNHFIRVHAPKNHECSICKRSFGSASILEAHKSESHVNLMCSECGKTFTNRHTLKMHEIGHTLKIVCKDCGRVYKSQTTYKKHLILNICGQKTRASPSNAKFTCDYCNKRYTQKVSLRVHIQYEHGNYKSHECKWCKKKFWAPSRLKAHIVKHTQEKKFSCTICGGKFVTKESLLYHTRIHTGEKPYKCDFCEQSFISASRKVDHIKRHHTNAIFQCSMCKIKYTTKVCLEKHMKTHIKDEVARSEQKSSELNFKLPIDDDLYLEEESYYVS
ncbi:zinc finger protein 14-like [Colias croceus]|uniref:zinc finger protein 14-like n=1 Tax=Colias crocea TaxID=72248 RepID=UPI001E27BF5C|nr:zinc finger protein 14-like [Colias croceus]